MGPFRARIGATPPPATRAAVRDLDLDLPVAPDDLDPGPAESWETTRARLDAEHRQQMVRLAAAPDARLGEKAQDLEHEVHHRSQLDAWLALAGTAPPQIYGSSMEEALAKVGEGR